MGRVSNLQTPIVFRLRRCFRIRNNDQSRAERRRGSSLHFLFLFVGNNGFFFCFCRASKTDEIRFTERANYRLRIYRITIFYFVYVRRTGHVTFVRRYIFRSVSVRWFYNTTKREKRVSAPLSDYYDSSYFGKMISVRVNRVGRE